MSTPPRAPITPGTIIGERYCLVERYLGPRREDLAETGGGRAFVAEVVPERTERVVVHIYTPEVAPLYEEWREFFDRCMRCRHKTLASLLGHGIHEGLPYLVSELMHGHPLSEAIDRKGREHSAFLPRTALSLLKPIARALTVVHEHSCHGVISPETIYVQRGGSTRLAGLGHAAFGREVGRRILGHRSADARFSAPELRADPGAITKLSDIYSLGLVTVSMLTGSFPDPKEPAALADQFLTAVPETLALAISDALSADPSGRPYSTESFIQRLDDGIEDLRAQIMELSGSPEAVVEGTEPKPEQHGFERRGSLSGLIAATELPPTPQEDDPTVWLVHRDGLDYGPYSAEQVREQLLQDQISEHTEIRNLDTGERGFLVELQEFTEFVADYIPQREERRRREAERRAEVQRKVKRASAAGIISAFVGILGILGFYIYYLEFIRPQPEPIPFERVFARVRTDFAPPNLGYVGIAADPELIASLFDFSEEEPAPIRRRSRPRSDGTAAEYDEGDPNDLGTIDFLSSGGSGRRLTVTEVARVVRAEGRAIQRCFTEERRNNDRYDRIGRVTVRFTVRPNGVPVGVSLEPGRYSSELNSCLVRIFRGFRYPEFDGLALPFSFPIDVP